MNGLVAILAGGHGGYAIALALTVAATFRFVKWLVPFTCERMDVSRGEIGKRLKHVEHELDATRAALFLLLNRMAEKYPSDPVLGEVGEILRRAWPVNTRDADPDRDLINKLDGIGGASVAAA